MKINFQAGNLLTTLKCEIWNSHNCIDEDCILLGYGAVWNISPRLHRYWRGSLLRNVGHYLPIDMVYYVRKLKSSCSKSRNIVSVKFRQTTVWKRDAAAGTVREADGAPSTSTEFKAEWIYKSTPSYTFMECEGKTVLYTSVNVRLLHTGCFIFHCPSSVLFSVTLHPLTSDFGSHIFAFLWLRPINRATTMILSQV